MNTLRKDLLLYHGRELIARVRAYTAEGKAHFFADLKTQDAVLRNIEIIGQIVRDLQIDWLHEQYPTLPWRQITGMRNIIAHAYLGIELAEVWNTVERDLADLDTAFAHIATVHGFTPFSGA